MKTKKKSGFRIGVLTVLTAAGTVYYYMKKNNKSASDMLDDGINTVEDVAQGANQAIKDAASYTQSKAKGMFKNAKEDFKDGANKVEDGFYDVTKDIKKEVEKTY